MGGLQRDEPKPAFKFLENVDAGQMLLILNHLFLVSLMQESDAKCFESVDTCLFQSSHDLTQFFLLKMSGKNIFYSIPLFILTTLLGSPLFCFCFGEVGQPLFERVDLVETMVEELLSSIVEGIELKLSKLSEHWVKEDESSSVGAASSVSVRSRIAFGERKGQKVRRMGYRQEPGTFSLKGRYCAEGSGYTPHTGRLYGRLFRNAHGDLI